MADNLWESYSINFGGSMKSIGIFVNLEKDANFNITKEIISTIESMGANCEVATIGKEYDFVISLGGDGTFLAVARNFPSIEIVGINLGNLGFLAEIDKDNFKEALERILSGNYSVEKRFFIETTIHDKTLYALNDIVVSRGIIPKLLELELYFNGKFVDNYTADGLIISTPTGSTAYSMSAGGPIVDPKLDVLIVTPICAHSLHQRPIIIDASTEVKIKAKVDGFLIAADGQETVESENIKEIVINRSTNYTKLIKISENCFFNTVREKFNI